MKTLSYPNYDYYMPAQPVRDLDKWVKAARELYYQIHKGTERQAALQQITKDWDIMDRLDFQNWLKFYQEGAQNKYAQVNYWGSQDNLGYYLPIPQEKALPMPAKLDMHALQTPEQHPDLLQEEKRQTIEKIRQKVLSRIDSARKLLRSPEGQLLTGPELEGCLDSIHQLEKKIQMVNKISTSVRLYQDMIVREANVLSGKGFKQASDFMIKIAQAVPSVAEPPNPAQIGDGQAGMVPGQSAGEVPPDNQSPSPNTISVDVSQQGTPPEMPPTAPPTPDTAQKLSPGMEEFLAGLNDVMVPTDNLEVDEGDLNDFVVEAQDAAVPELPPETPLEVEEPAPTSGGFDQIVDGAMDHITVQDIITQLEGVANVFRNREIARQLALVDIGLNKLGLASMFGTMGEIIQKSLEANNYILTRLDDILSRLHGATTTSVQPKEPTPPTPETSAVKQRLQQEDNKDEQRKKMRKELENAKLEQATKPTPQVEMQQELAQPATVASTPPPVPNV